MSTPNERHQRSRLMRLMRVSPVPILLLGLVGGTLMANASRTADGVRDPLFWDAGTSMLSLGGALLVAVLWGAVYLQVVESSRGSPGLQAVEEPSLEPEPAAQLEALKRDLSELGFRPGEWFSLDDFDETHVGAWTHAESPTAAFVLYFPAGRTFRLRFVRKFPNGGILATSTRLTDLSYAPPQGVYLQARTAASVEELWAWHLDGEALFPVGPSESAARPDGPRELYVEVAARWAGHVRRDRTWLLAIEPIEECWRIYWLSGMPLRQQFELGWTTPFWQ